MFTLTALTLNRRKKNHWIQDRRLLQLKYQWVDSSSLLSWGSTLATSSRRRRNKSSSIRKISNKAKPISSVGQEGCLRPMGFDKGDLNEDPKDSSGVRADDGYPEPFLIVPARRASRRSEQFRFIAHPTVQHESWGGVLSLPWFSHASLIITLPWLILRSRPIV
jgi:hypothetical protein